MPSNKRRKTFKKTTPDQSMKREKVADHFIIAGFCDEIDDQSKEKVSKD
jgi:hypothetical protein